MARVHYIKKARKLWKCEKCGKQIERGQPYKHVSPRPGRWTRGRKRIRCATCPTWKRSELSFSKMVGVYAAEEDFAEVLASWDPEDGLESIESGLEEFATQVEGVADEYDESADNMEDGFGHPTSTSDELREKADDLRYWADDVREALSSVDEGRTGDELRDEVEDMVSITDECPV